MAVESSFPGKLDYNTVIGLFHGRELLGSGDNMFYGVDFDRVFHDFVINSQDSCTDDSLCGRVTAMLRNMCGVLEKCGPRLES